MLNHQLSILTGDLFSVQYNHEITPGAQMTDNPSLMIFPCDFQIKIMGKNSPAFSTDVINITRKHFPTIQDDSIKSQPSKQSNYIAISVTVHALNQATLDALYQELTQHPDIKMVL